MIAASRAVFADALKMPSASKMIGSQVQKNKNHYLSSSKGESDNLCAEN
jgi:hypothetical protein